MQRKQTNTRFKLVLVCLHGFCFIVTPKKSYKHKGTHVNKQSQPGSKKPTNKMSNTFSNGCLGSHNDEERSEMRYVMRIAKHSESSKL